MRATIAEVKTQTEECDDPSCTTELVEFKQRFLTISQQAVADLESICQFALCQEVQDMQKNVAANIPWLYNTYITWFCMSTDEVQLWALRVPHSECVRYSMPRRSNSAKQST